MRTIDVLFCAAVALAGCGSRAGSQAPSPPPPPPVQPDASPEADFHTKHLTFDDDLDGGGAPENHTDVLWGNYVDRYGNPAVGWHSHDPDTGEPIPSTK